MTKDKLNLNELMNNLNQVGLNVIDFDNINLDYLEKNVTKMQSNNNNQ